MNETTDPRPFGGYLFSPVRDAAGVVHWMPDELRPFFSSAPPAEISAPPAPLPGKSGAEYSKNYSKPAGIGAWYVSKRTDLELGSAPEFGDLDETERYVWFGALAREDEGACARAWVGVRKWIAATFPGCHALRKPWMTGLTLIEHTLPWPLNKARPYRYLTLSDELRRLIAATSTQHRMELLTEPLALPGKTLRRYVVYDARVEFAACLRHLPVILAGEDGAPSVTHDSDPVFEPFRPGRYLVEVTVPRGWSHIGLAPRKARDGVRWEWPATPGESWATWLDECELRLLEQRGWPYVVRQRLLFATPKTPGSDPLREYAERLCAELERVERYPKTPAMRAYRAALRALVIHPVGAWHKGAGSDRRHVDSLDELTPEDAEADILRDDARNGQGWTVANQVELTPFRSRWWRPEMSSAVYARERVAATRRALDLPRAALLAIRGDALHLADYDPGWQDTGKVGAYRRQISYAFATPCSAPTTAAELAAMRQEIEQ